METLKAPLPYFGGKSKAAHIIWERFGNPHHYVEPFFGSGAVLLARPHEPQVETCSDKNHFIANLYRALRDDPEKVAYYADRPVIEVDMHAIHKHLVFKVQRETDFVQKMQDDYSYYDAEVAGLWLFGACAWIGSGWCPIDDDTLSISGQVPHLTGDGQGIHARSLSQQVPILFNAGRGIHQVTLSQKRPNIGDSAAGRGIISLTQKLPKLTHGRDVAPELSQQMPKVTHSSFLLTNENLIEYFLKLSERLRRVRVCCGDFKRILTPAVLQINEPNPSNVTAILLDPPYADTAGRKANLYSSDSLTVAHEAREWAIANGDNPRLRIALCGYEQEHVMPDSWEKVAWKTAGGYANQGDSRENRKKERIWFSPHCLKAKQVGLFDDLELE